MSGEAPPPADRPPSPTPVAPTTGDPAPPRSAYVPAEGHSATPGTGVPIAGSPPTAAYAQSPAYPPAAGYPPGGYGPPPGYLPAGYGPPPYPPAGYGPPPGYLPAGAAAPRIDPAGVRPTLVLGGVIAAIFFGSQILNAIIPTGSASAQPQQPGGVVAIGQLQISLAPGWQAFDGPAGMRLAKAAVAIDIVDVSFSGDASTLYQDFVAQALAPNAMGFGATPPSLVEIGSGLPAARGAYTGVFGEAGEVEGQLTALVLDGQGYVFDAWGPVGSLSQLLDEVELMLRTIQIGQ